MTPRELKLYQNVRDRLCLALHYIKENTSMNNPKLGEYLGMDTSSVSKYVNRGKLLTELKVKLPRSQI